MATIEEAVYARLTGFAEVSALVGTRVYPLVAPQDAVMPALAYQKVSSVPERSHTGFSGITPTRIQVTCEADDYASAKALAAAVRHCWESFIGTVSGLKIRSWIENEIDGWSEEHAAPVVRVDVMMWHDEV